MSWSVRPATADDMAAVAEIVNEHIAGGVAHFGEGAQSAQVWLAEWQQSRERFPWLVAVRGVEVGAIAHAKRFNSRAAYDWTAEVSVYVRDDLGGQGVGTALYRRLIETLDAQGYRCLVAGITTPNDASVRLHEKFGFRHLGTLERVGYKHGRWLDVGSWQRHHGPQDDSPPAPILPVSEVQPGGAPDSRTDSAPDR
jgi:phosphinothricin acetyltransferase